MTEASIDHQSIIIDDCSGSPVSPHLLAGRRLHVEEGVHERPDELRRLRLAHAVEERTAELDEAGQLCDDNAHSSHSMITSSILPIR